MWLSLVALSSIVPALAQAFRTGAGRDAVFWAALGVAIAGPVLLVVEHSGPVWQTGLSATLWITIAATLTLYAIVCAVFRHAWRLTPLVAGYMMLLAAGAIVWQDASGAALQAGTGERAWVNVHIATAVVTYGLVTIAAVAATSAFLQEWTLKRKRRTVLTRLLPSVADCDSLQLRLLQYGEAVLSVGLATGMALQYRETGALLAVSHKTILTVAAFVVIGLLLVVHDWAGVRGRQAARIALLGYLLLTLGYPGVKFVTEVLIG